MVMQTEAISPLDPTRVSPILTDLWRYTQPIIRYRLGDILRLDATPCPCGSSWQRIAAIEGRQDDLCWFPRADETLRPVFPDAIRRMILLADARIVEYRAEQHAAGTLDIQVAVHIPDDFASVAARLQHSVHDALRDYGCRAVALSVSAGLTAPAPGAKRRRVICTWRANQAPSAVLTG